MPLFPSASNDDKETAVSPESKSWLQNSSFPQHLVSEVNQLPSSCQAAQSAPTIPSTSTTLITSDKVSSSRKKKKLKKHKHSKEGAKSGDKLIKAYKTYEIHRKRDKNNYTYQSLYSYDVPKYKNKFKIIVGDDQTELYKKLLQPASDNSYRYWKSCHKPELHLEHQSRFFKIDADYVSLTVASQCWEEIRDTREIEVPDPARHNPHDEQAWIEFIRSTGTNKSGLDRRLAICDKALKFLPNSFSIIKHKIDTAKRLLSNTEIGHVWTNILFNYPNLLDIWLMYLEYKETDFNLLNYTSVMAAYRKCLATLVGFQRGTFRSHEFNGDIEIALIQVIGRLLRFLKISGYVEQAIALEIALLEILTLPASHNKDDFLSFWDKGMCYLGSEKYCDWWKPNTWVCEEREEDTVVAKDEDIWCAWFREESKKDTECCGPVFSREADDVIDTDCKVSSAWIKSYIYQCSSSYSSELILETFRSYLPAQYRSTPLLPLSDCALDLPVKTAGRLLRQYGCIYMRLLPTQQTTTGLIRVLLTNLLTPKKVDKFIKSLLKEVSHRNNISYWILYVRSLSDVPTKVQILSKLLSSPVSSYAKLALEHVLTELTFPNHPDDSSEAKHARAEVSALLRKRPEMTEESRVGGSTLALMFCKSYRLHLVEGEASVELLTEFLSAYLPELLKSQVLTDTYLVLHHIIMLERSQLGCPKRLKMVSTLAVQQFPEIQEFWNCLQKVVGYSPNLWKRLLKSENETVWYKIICLEVEKQESNPDIKLSNKILSLSENAVSRHPSSLLLWQQYIRNTLKYAEHSIKGIVVRSIKSNPSVKSLYLSGIKYSPEDRESIYKLLEEKQLRLRVLKEEIMMLSTLDY